MKLISELLYKLTLQIHSTIFNDSRVKYEQYKNKKIQGKTVDEWDLQWINVGSINDLIYHTAHLNNYIGLYRLRLNNEVLFIGYSVDYYRGGLRTELLESIKNNRELYIMEQNCEIDDLDITVDVLITGNSPRSVDYTKELNSLIIGKYLPRFN